MDGVNKEDHGSFFLLSRVTVSREQSDAGIYKVESFHEEGSRGGSWSRKLMGLGG